MSDRINTIDELKAFITYAVLGTEDGLEFVHEQDHQVFCAVAGKNAQVAKQIEQMTGMKFIKTAKILFATDSDRNVTIGLSPAGQATLLTANLHAEYMQDMAKYANP